MRHIQGNSVLLRGSRRGIRVAERSGYRGLTVTTGRSWFAHILLGFQQARNNWFVPPIVCEKYISLIFSSDHRAIVPLKEAPRNSGTFCVDAYDTDGLFVRSFGEEPFRGYVNIARLDLFLNALLANKHADNYFNALLRSHCVCFQVLHDMAGRSFFIRIDSRRLMWRSLGA